MSFNRTNAIANAGEMVETQSGAPTGRAADNRQATSRSTVGAPAGPRRKRAGPRPIGDLTAVVSARAAARVDLSSRYRSKGKGRSTRAHNARARTDVDRLRVAFESIYGRSARFSERRWRAELERALRRLDRYADFGRGRRGAGRELAISLMTTDVKMAREGGTKPVPQSLAYYIPILDAISKDWRRAQKPHIKAARRRARGGGRT